jgi:DNA-binding transcriptional LysR family regulator
MIQGKLDSFATRHPEVQLHLEQMGDTEPLSGIVDGSVDMICTREPAVIPEGWVFERCIDDVLIVVCGADHPFADKEKVSLKTLGEAKWLLNRVGSVARNRFEEIAQANDWPQEARCQVVMHIPELTKQMLMTGKYMAILPRSVALPWLGTGAIRELNSDINTSLRPLGFLWTKTQAGTAVALFAAHLRAQAKGGA